MEHQKSTTQLIGVSLASRLYVAALNLGTVPILISLIGIEAFGLIGLSFTLQALVIILDTGLGSAVSRELARTGPGGKIVQAAVVASKGIERFYWVCVPAVCAITYFGSLAIADGWEESSRLSEAVISSCLLLLSGSIAVQWLFGFYSLALLGLGRAQDVAFLNAITWTLRLGGGVVVAVVTAGSVVAYFAWQLATAALSVLVFSRVLRIRAPMWEKTRAGIVGGFRVLGKTALSISALSACFLIFNQVDKVIVGSQFSLEVFGYYSLAWQIAGALYLLYSPVYNVYLPILAAAFHKEGASSLSGHVADGTLLLTILVGPAATVIVLFPVDVLFIWTGDLVIAESAGRFLALAFAGASVSSLLFVAYAAQLAALRTDLTLRPILVALVSLLIAMYFVVRLGNPILVVSVWVFFNASYVIAAMSMTAMIVLKARLLTWWWRNVIGVVLPGVLIALAARPLVPIAAESSRPKSLILLGSIYLLALGAALISDSRARNSCRKAIHRMTALLATGR